MFHATALLPRASRLVGMLLLSATLLRISPADGEAEDDYRGYNQDNEETWQQVIPVEACEHQRILSFAMAIWLAF